MFIAAISRMRPRMHLGTRVPAFLGALACACIAFGAIPLLSLPTLGQALWASGFAQSYVHSGWFAIYATDFGLPTPAPISFGLSATFVQGLLIRTLGVAAVDAYTLTAVLYLALALHGASAMARLLGASFFPSLAAGLLWLSLPLVWNHVGYSMLALGFALLPFYLYCACRLLVPENRVLDTLNVARFFFACVVSIFMDGYTFMMFLAATAVVWLGTLWNGSSPRTRMLVFVLPCMTAAFGVAYFLYTSFIGAHSYVASPPNFFRAWGVDVTMLLWPTRGVHWLWDSMGVSTIRNERMFWGDGSVWITTFLAPLLVTGFCGYSLARRHPRAAALLGMALVGLYLALGPSLKVNSTKQVEGIPLEDRGSLMPEHYAWMPTGSGWLWANLPGFRDMRAVYRWAGLGALGLWGLTVLLLLRAHARHPGLAYATALLLIVAFLPHPEQTIRRAIAYRRQADLIDAALSDDLHRVASKGGRLFFAPHGNDFIVNYLAAQNDFASHNIGGDKNVKLAQLAWSEPMRALSSPNLTSAQFRRDLRSLLLGGTVDAVVFPYFDTTRSAHQWPPPAASIRALREQRLPVARAAATSPCFQVQEFRLFVAVSLSDTGRHYKDALIESADAFPAVVQACQSAD